MARLQFDQVNVVVADVASASRFLREIGLDVPTADPDWADWSAHHRLLPTAAEDFAAELDSTTFARHWGGLPAGFTGVVVNLRTAQRSDVDVVYQRALTLGAEGLRAPHDAFWGARYAVILGPGPIVVGLMSPADPEHRRAGPELTDFVDGT